MTTIDIDYLIDQLEKLRDRGVQVPLTKMVLIDEEQFLRLINQLRISVPKEVQEARHLHQERDRLMAQAQERAHNIVALAEQRVEEMVNEQGIAELATEREKSIIERAQDDAQDIRAQADTYALRVLQELSVQLGTFQNTVQNGIDVLEQGGPSSSGPGDIFEDEGSEVPIADEEYVDQIP